MSTALAPAPSPQTESPPEPSGLEVTPPSRDDENSLPTWFRERVEEARKEFQRLPIPGPKNEAWRYSSARRITLSRFGPASTASAAEERKAIEQSMGLSAVAARFVFVNDRLVHADASGLPAGVIACPFEQALRDHSELLSRHFMKREAFLGSDKFAALHLANVKAGLVVLAPKGILIEHPIEVFYWVTKTDAAIFPHTLAITEDHAAATVVDHYRSLGQEGGLCIAVTDLIAGKSSQLNYIACQEMGARGQAIHLSSTTTSRDAQVKSFQLQLGAEFSRTESVSDLIGEGSRSDMLSVSMPAGDQLVDQRTLQRHIAPHAASDLLYKNALYDRARTVFAGLIHVFEDAHYTDAYQKCRNLLNSDEAEANSLPGLEINADQVKCSHGSTSGPVSEEELFYLKARGIGDAEARKLIVLGFLQDVINRIGNEAIKGMIRERLERKFAHLG